MTMRAAGWWMVAAMLLASSAALAQSAPARPKGTVVPASAPPIVGDRRGPAIVPAKPSIAPRIGPGGDAGATPSAARAESAQTRRLSITARQSVEKTIAALVAAMKDVPRRPDPSPGASTVTPRRAVARPAGPDAATPLEYRVTWPAPSAEPVPAARRIELAWPDSARAGSIALRWDDAAAR
jgi:hypothetical protein